MDQHDSLSAPVQSGRCGGLLALPAGRQQKAVIAVCVVFALVPILNSAFYALNSSYYARWFYMPVLILAAMTVSAWEDPSSTSPAPPGALPL